MLVASADVGRYNAKNYAVVDFLMLFWSAFILTRPLGAALGDLLTKPVATGGFNLSRISSSLIIAAFIFLCILFTRQRAGDHPGRPEQS